MDRFERFQKIHQLLLARRAVSRRTFLEVLEVSPATFKRDLEYLRDRMRAPIVWDAERRGYRYDHETGVDPHLLVPGLWFNAREIHALLAMRALLGGVGAGLLAAHVDPLVERLEKILEGAGLDGQALQQRVRILQQAARAAPPKAFGQAARAVLERKRLTILHYNRQSGERLRREISPQRLVHYRDNWYLDAWCHVRRGIRSFALDAIEEIAESETRAQELKPAELDAALGEGYGIFAGPAKARAILRFSPQRARWVARETWHPQQSGRFEADGHYVLEVPYGDDRELILDIQRHGADVEVVGPPELRAKVAAALAAAAARYN